VNELNRFTFLDSIRWVHGGKILKLSNALKS
jgi:hypothetical protein